MVLRAGSLSCPAHVDFSQLIVQKHSRSLIGFYCFKFFFRSKIIKMDEPKLKQIRKGAKASITRIGNWVTTNRDIVDDIFQFITRLEVLESAFSKYNEAQDTLECDFPDNGDTENRDAEENLYFNTHALLRSCISKLTPKTSKSDDQSSMSSLSSRGMQNVHSQVEVKLPLININPFHGNPSDWASFFQLFTALIIDNASLVNVQRFIYLKSFLRDEPLQLVDKLAVTNENFPTAVEILRKRYENQISVINAHFSALLETQPMTKCNASTLRTFLTNCKKQLSSLKNLNYPSEKLWEFLLIYLLTKKLDFGTRKSFETERDLDELPNLENFLEFIEKRCLIFENLSGMDRTANHRPRISSGASLVTLEKKMPACLHCNDKSHKIYTCLKFKGLPLEEKRAFVFSKKICFNCLGSKHMSSQCPNKTGCLICSQRHHTLLHQSQPVLSRGTVAAGQSTRTYTGSQSTHLPSQPQRSHSQPQHRNSDTRDNSHSSQLAVSHDSLQEASLVSALSTKNSLVLLATACVSLYDKNGRCIQAKAILDCGSQTSFITEKLVKALDLDPYLRPTHITGIALSDNISKKMVDIVVHSNAYSYRKFPLSCAVLPVITCSLPQMQINTSSWRIPTDIILADPTFSTPSEIQLLIGADLYYDLISRGMIKLGDGLPNIINTHLGWVLGGSFVQDTADVYSVSHLSTKLNFYSVSLFAKGQSNDNLECAISKFWEMEEIPRKVPFTSEEDAAEQIFLDTTVVLEDGSYQVNLPMKPNWDGFKLGDSFGIARRRFEGLEKKFGRDADYYLQYSNFIQEYVSLGHGKFVPLEINHVNGQPKYFFPHHAVVKEDSLTTKLRVVFDGSCKTTSGYSLNEVMLKGYQVQPDLFEILCRFRSYKFVLTSDIQKMFRQIKVNPKQTYLLNILWRNTPDEALKCIELTTVTYGTNCAPFLATRVIKDIALKNSSSYPLASQALNQQCYIDDILGGADTQAELECLYDELTVLLNSHHFSLHKWRTNSLPLRETICRFDTLDYDIDFDEHPNKVLGLKWNSSSDYFCVAIPQVNFGDSVTKRNILSVVARCYDPLGFLSLIIISGKLLIQALWNEKLDWDSPISNSSILTQWTRFVNDLPLLKTLKIPRYIFLDKSILQIEFHGFSDASLKAYAACVYVRALYTDGSVSCRLVSSKSRVAPLKTITLPRLELCGMLLLSRLVKEIQSIFDSRFSIDSVNLWSDSKIALCWVQGEPSKWNIFVGNRVAQIQEMTSNFKWRHVRSEFNPADLPSRGVSISEVENCSLWWNGPEFLLKQDLRLEDYDTDITMSKLPEQRKVAMVNTLSTNLDFWFDLFERFSSFLRLQRVTAYILRFTHSLRHKQQERLGDFLSIDELTQAQTLLVRMAQIQCFAKEILSLTQGKSVQDKQIARLNPFLDDSGMLRVGGRIVNSEHSFAQKHPLLLPPRHKLVTLLLTQEHKRLGHAGAQTVLSNFRLRFWPLNGLREIKRIIRRCVICFRFSARPAEQLMGDLPAERVCRCRVFSRVGVDYGGPFLLKSSHLRKAPLIKAYIAIFVCLVTKAVHIELVTGLSTELYLMTLKRFIARRGKPSIVYSDNATNFLGASNSLKDLHSFLKSQETSAAVKEALAKDEIEFKFIPPRSPHWGGLWEAAIKSTKYHLRRLVGETKFTFEEFYTILVQVEAILNSRPLYPLSDDPNDLGSLTPGHFLVGDSLTAYPEKDLVSVPENRLNVWKKITQIHQTFWKRWSVDYLNRLQNRPKWVRSHPNLKVDTLVLLKDENSPPLKWPLARVVEVLPGPDGRVRAVKVKTKEGIFTRSIVKVCPLWCDEQPQ